MNSADTLILTEEQRLLQKSAHELFDAIAPISELRRLRDNEDTNAFVPELWKKMAELGWSAMLIPDKYEGIDFGFGGLSVVMCEAGRNLSASPLLMTAVVGSSIILRSAPEDIKKQILPQIVRGSCTVTLALEEGVGHEPYVTEAIAEGKGTQRTLSGQKRFVLDGGFADFILVTARCTKDKSSDKNFGLFLVDAKAKGVKRTSLRTLDSRNVADISFKNAPATLLAEGAKAISALDFALDITRIAIAAEMLGSAWECFDRTVGYLKEREQFGVKIGSFQSLQHRAAQLYTHLELTRSVVLDASAKAERAWDSTDKKILTELAMASAHAKTYANDCYRHVSAEGIQMHGGIGMTDEFDIGFFMKRMQVATQSFGNSQYLRTRYANLAGF